MTSGSLGVEPTCPQPTPDEAAARKDSQEALSSDLAAAIMTLPQIDRIIVTECYLMGKTQAEVARDLNRRPQRVSEAIVRILDRLAFLLEEQRIEYGLRKRGSGPTPSGGE